MIPLSSARCWCDWLTALMLPLLLVGCSKSGSDQKWVYAQHYFGIVSNLALGERRHTFKIKNETSDVWAVDDESSSCMCTKVSFASRTVGPGEFLEASLGLNLTKKGKTAGVVLARLGGERFLRLEASCDVADDASWTNVRQDDPLIRDVETELLLGFYMRSDESAPPPPPDLSITMGREVNVLTSRTKYLRTTEAADNRFTHFFEFKLQLLPIASGVSYGQVQAKVGTVPIVDELKLIIRDPVVASPPLMYVQLDRPEANDIEFLLEGKLPHERYDLKASRLAFSDVKVGRIDGNSVRVRAKASLPPNQSGYFADKISVVELGEQGKAVCEIPITGFLSVKDVK